MTMGRTGDFVRTEPRRAVAGGSTGPFAAGGWKGELVIGGFVYRHQKEGWSLVSGDIKER